LLNTCRGKSVWLVDCRVFISLSFRKICVVVSFHFHLPFVAHFIASHKCSSTSFRLTLFDCWVVWFFVAALVDCWSVSLVLRDAGPRFTVFVATLWLLVVSFFVSCDGGNSDGFVVGFLFLVDCWSVLLVLRDAGPRSTVFVATLWLLVGCLFLSFCYFLLISLPLFLHLFHPLDSRRLIVGCFLFGLLRWWRQRRFYCWFSSAAARRRQFGCWIWGFFFFFLWWWRGQRHFSC
jgi:hypothetical protein